MGCKWVEVGDSDRCNWVRLGLAMRAVLLGIVAAGTFRE